MILHTFFSSGKSLFYRGVLQTFFSFLLLVFLQSSFVPHAGAETGNGSVSAKKNVVIGAVRQAYAFKESLRQHLEKSGHSVLDIGCSSESDLTNFPEIGEAIAYAIYSGKAEFGIICCNSGSSAMAGISKYRGIMAFASESVKTAELSRKANNANVLCLGQSAVSHELATQIVDAFLQARFLDLPKLSEEARLEKKKTCDSIREKGIIPRPGPLCLVTDLHFPENGVAEESETGKGIDGEGGLTLDQCIELALAHNPGLARQFWQAESLDDTRRALFASRLPQLDVKASHSLYQEERMISPRRRGDGNVLAFSDNLFVAGLVLELPLFTGGRLRNQVSAAEFLSEAAHLELAYSRTELVFNVSSLFYAILQQREVLASLMFSRQALKQHHITTQELVDAKKAARVDLLRTEVRLADIEQQILRERNDLEVQRLTLAGLIGIRSDDNEFAINGTLEPPAAVFNQKATLLEALSRRQDYQAALVRIEARRRQLQAASGDRYPQLALRAGYGNQWDLDSDDSNEIGEIGLVLTMPLFSGGQITAEINRARKLLKAEEEGLRQIHLGIQVQVECALSDIHATRARFEVTSKSVAQAEESLRVEQDKYSQGKGSIVDVLDAQAALLSLQTNYYASLAACHRAIARLEMVMGGEDKPVADTVEKPL